MTSAERWFDSIADAPPRQSFDEHTRVRIRAGHGGAQLRIVTVLADTSIHGKDLDEAKTAGIVPARLIELG